MEESKKFYSQRAISITTFFGGPLAAGILIRQNYLNVDKEQLGKNALFIGIVSTILIFGGLLALPESIIDKIPNALFPAIYAGIIYLIVEKTQGKELKSHKENNGEFYSTWKAAKIGALSMIGILLTIASVAFISGDLSKTEPEFDATSYDNGLETFFKNESISLQVFNSIETSSSQYLITEFNKGVVIWKDNKKIIENLNLIEKLPLELLEQNEKLSKYCELRIEHFEIILKALTEDTDEYGKQIDNIGIEIEKVIQELQQ